MSRSLWVRNQHPTRRVNLPLLRQITLTLLDELFLLKRFDLGLVLVESAEITRLNEKFLHHAGSTDVITFGYSTPTPVPPRVRRPAPPLNRKAVTPHRTSKLLHAEIFICVDEAIAQARRFRTTWPSELIRYLIHGLLHLLGYDDSKAAPRRKMKREEVRLLRELAHRFPVETLGKQSSS